MINFTKIKYYRQQIRLLLMERPELRILQRKIDTAMQNAGNQHNRCVLLQIMMKDKIWELQKVCESVLKDLGGKND